MCFWAGLYGFIHAFGGRAIPNSLLTFRGVRARISISSCRLRRMHLFPEVSDMTTQRGRRRTNYPIRSENRDSFFFFRAED